MRGYLQTTLEKEADFLRKVITPQGEELIIHLEFQTSDEKNMVYRMQEYYAILQKKYQLPVIQFVIYVGEKPPQMRTTLNKEEIFSGFELMNLKETGYEKLLDSSIPEEVLLAILGDFADQNAGEVLQQIIVKLAKLIPHPIALNKYLRQLLIFARLRNLTEETEKQLNTMAFTYDIEKDALFKRGEAKGKTENARQVVIKLLKMGKLTFDEIAQVTGFSREQVEDIAKDN